MAFLEKSISAIYYAVLSESVAHARKNIRRSRSCKERNEADGEFGLEKGAGGGDVRESGFDDFVVRLMQTGHAFDHRHGKEGVKSLSVALPRGAYARQPA